MNIPADTPLEHRLYYRCCACLSTVCVAMEKPDHNVECGICGGYMEFMGHVQGDKFKRQETGQGIKCNSECQCANGPKCECSCGGANHGIGFAYDITIEGRVKITSTSEKDTRKRRIIAEEYHREKDAALDRIQMKYGQVWEDYKRNRWISDKALWWKLKCIDETLNKAVNGVRHSNRIAKFKSIVPVSELFGSAS